MRILALLAIVFCAAPGRAEESTYRGWPPAERAAQAELEKLLDRVPAAERLAAWHERFTTEPHPAGTAADGRMIRDLARAFEELGLEVDVHRFYAYLPEPVTARLEIVAEPSTPGPFDEVFAGAVAAELPLALPLRERPLAADPYSRHPDLGFAWNAYSGSGDVTAGAVYANYARREDFETLAELGVEVAGKIVVARYGQIFRGHKARFAEAAGAAGLVLFTDPADSGYVRGPVYPEGGWANASYIERGSIKTLPYPGDPLTPFEPATADGPRFDPAKVALPTIPVQPIGWGAGYEILRRMRGQPVPAGWQGGLPLAYRTGGGALRLRLRVEQRRRIAESANVIGRLEGARWPEQTVIVGCHFDAWTFGAGDPHAGTILLYEAARSFAAAAREGRRPARTILFANWGAEEQGIIGSTEWVEARRDELEKNAVAYVNLDGAATGPNFRASAAPSLKRLILDAARAVPAGPDATVFDRWRGEADAEPGFGNLGGGSDHVGFYCHLGIPSVGLSARGSPGTAYHSAYDTLAWYRQVVGADYAPALMLTRLVNVVLARLANATLLPLDVVRYGEDLESHLAALGERAVELGRSTALGELVTAAAAYRAAAEATAVRLETAVESGALDAETLAEVNRVLLGFERGWLHPPGLPDRPWFRNLYAATDPETGYGAWVLPALRHAIERRSPEALDAAVDLYLEALERLQTRLETIDALLLPAAPERSAAEPGGKVIAYGSFELTYRDVDRQTAVAVLARAERALREVADFLAIVPETRIRIDIGRHDRAAVERASGGEPVIRLPARRLPDDVALVAEVTRALVDGALPFFEDGLAVDLQTRFGAPVYLAEGEDLHRETARLARRLGGFLPLENVAAGERGAGARKRRLALLQAGSFCRYLIDTQGVETFLRVVRGAELDAVYGADLRELETRWHAFLAAEASADP